MEYVNAGLSALAIVMFIVVLVKLRKIDSKSDRIGNDVSGVSAQVENSKTETIRMIDSTGKGMGQSIGQIGNLIGENQQQAARMQDGRLEELSKRQYGFQNAVNQQFSAMSLSLNSQLDTMLGRIENLEKTNSESMRAIREENNRKLDEIRGTVDEKLQSTLEKRIQESFRTVSEQLDLVHKGLGEMQNLANDVGGLKKVLSGVKTRGILGEIQLGAILSEILAPEQYDTNVAVIPGKSERVEFAVKLPGAEKTVYLPIDSKFPGESYQKLLDAQSSGDASAVAEARKNLETVITREAKDIHDKYIEVPYTTNFGIMFLPFEGLYAEVVGSGLLETLQNKYNVNVAGPSTMAALLNSLQMGFRTLAIRKRSGEVWKVLGEVRTEFGKFEDVLGKVQKNLTKTSEDLDTLIGTRTRSINKKLGKVQLLEEDSATDDTFSVSFLTGDE